MNQTTNRTARHAAPQARGRRPQVHSGRPQVHNGKPQVHNGRPQVHNGKPQVRHSRAPWRVAKQRRVNRLGALIAVAAVLAFCSVALMPVMATLSQRAARNSGDTQLAQMDFELADIVTPQITLVPNVTLSPAAAPTPEPTPEPTLEPTPEPTPEPTLEPTPFAYLPVVYKADTSKKQIAVTVDDCYQYANLKHIVELAEDNGAKLTLFPVGETLERADTAALVKHCALELGYEIENHTYHHARIFRLPEEEMAAEIWDQRNALNQALGVDYNQHFLRLMGGDGETDQRTHNYLKQLGYLGIAKWSVSGSDSDMKHIEAALAPGQIYLFHTTDADTAKLEEFIPWAVSQGYKLVTLNALLGLPENETALLTQQGMPSPAPYTDDHHTQKVGDYTWTVLQLQEALRSQGYLKIDGPSTGYYGEQTAKAVAAFQSAHGLEASGEADADTQRMILEG